MSMGTTGNGTTAFEDELVGEAGWGESGWGEAGSEEAGWGEDEWVGEDELSQYAVGEWTGETGWGEAGWGESGVGEWTGEAGWGEGEWTGEDEWTGETGWGEYGVGEWTGETGWGEFTGEAGWGEYGVGEAGWGETYLGEDEGDPFLPLLAPLAMKALPLLAKSALPAVKSLLPMAKSAVSGVMKSVLGGGLPRIGGRSPLGGIGSLLGGGRPAPPRPPWAPRMPVPPRPPWAPPPRPPWGGPPMPPFPGPPPWGRPPAGGMSGSLTIGGSLSPEIAALLRQLSSALASGESAANQAESAFFGANEIHGELAANDRAHEAALTEVLAAEAAHSMDEREAGALIGATLPVTIRIMAGRPLRPVVPALARANTRLVVGLRRSGPAGPQLVRLVPTIQRRAVATLGAVARSGRPVTPRIVAPVVAAQAARVLSTPSIAGPALLRNTAVRRVTVAPAGAAARRPARGY